MGLVEQRTAFAEGPVSIDRGFVITPPLWRLCEWSKSRQQWSAALDAG